MRDGEALASCLYIIQVCHTPETLVHQVESQEHIAAKLPTMKAPKDEPQLN